MANSDAKWNEQSFLLDFMEQILYLNENAQYENFTQITTGDSTTTINQLLLGQQDRGKKAARFFNFKNEQLSGLVPQIRIFKVIQTNDGEKQQEFYFNDFTTVESIKSGTKERGTDVGIVSFNWEDLGTQPADTGVAFKATLTLYFQSIDGLFKDRGPNRPKFSDLAVPPPARSARQNGEKAKVDLINIEDSRKAHNPEEFKIKAVVGWAVPRDPNGVIYKNQDGIKDIDAIKQQRLSLLLNLYDHTIDFREDGSLQLTLEYMASIEGKMKGSAFDLLYIDDGDDLFNVISAKERNLRDAKAELRKIKLDADKAKKDPNLKYYQYSAPKKYAAGLLSRTALIRSKKDLELKELEIEALRKELQELNKELRGEAYQRLLNQLALKQKIYTYRVTDTQIGAWLNSISRDDSVTPEERTSYRQQVLSEFTSIGSVPLAVPLADFNQSLIGASSKQRKDAFKKYEEKLSSNAVQPETDVNFFFLGDLIEAAMQIIKDKPKGFKSQLLKLVGNLEDTPFGKQEDDSTSLKMVLGQMPFYFYDNTNNVKVTSIPISYIPISTKVFSAWFVKNVIKPLRESYNIHDFIRDVITELVSASIAPLTYGKISQFQKSNLAISSIAYPKKGSRVPPGSQPFVSIVIPSYDNDHGEKTILDQMFLIYYNGGMNKDLRGIEKTKTLKTGTRNRVEGDDIKGILHFKYGKDRGVVKSISLSKTDIPGAREMRLEKATKPAQANLLFSNKYDCSINIFGMTSFKPGMLLYLDPNSLGIPRDNNIAKNLGMGGYYRIIKVSNTSDSGKFETSLTAVFEGSANSSTDDPISHVDYDTFAARSKFLPKEQNSGVK